MTIFTNQQSMGINKESASSWLEIDQHAFEHNVRLYKSSVAPASLLAVIKSNAYGHGIDLIATLCDQLDAVDVIGVVSLQEALQLRLLGVRKKIVVLSIVRGDLKQAVVNDIDLVVYDQETILELNRLGEGLNKKAAIHIKVDTGLSRLGLLEVDSIKVITEMHRLPFINIEGIFTHFAQSEHADPTFTHQQIQQFTALLDHLEQAGIVIPCKHTACSAAASTFANARFNLVRVGIGLYGLWPSCENKRMTQKIYPSFSLKSVLSWKTRILQIKELPAGSYIGYGRTHQITKVSRIAVIPVGYWDGYDRNLSNRGYVLVNNQLARVIGRVAMNLTVIDITGLNVEKDHEITLLGDYPGITADDLALHCGTINYEIVTRINSLLPRYIKE